MGLEQEGATEGVVTQLEEHSDSSGLGVGNPSPGFAGTLFKQNGREYRLVAVPKEERTFRAPEGISEEDALRFESALRSFRKASRLVSDIAFKLCDPKDGNTIDGASRLAQAIDCLLSSDRDQIGKYVLSLFHHGGTLHGKLGSVLVPPCERSVFEGIIDELPFEVRDGFNWDAWLDHIYDPIPLNSQGFYLFDSEVDLDAFHLSIDSASPVYGRMCERISEIFTKALKRHGISDAEWNEYNELSQKIGEEQSEKINEILGDDPFLKGLSTRIYIRSEEDGTFCAKGVHYLDEFRAQFDDIASMLEGAASELPSWAGELKGVIEAKIEWLRSEDRNPDWGRTSRVWVDAIDPDQIIDFLLTAEEVQSHAGQKGMPQIAVAQHYDGFPSDLAGTLKILFDNARDLNVNPVLLRTLIVGGANEHGVLLGENLPDEGTPRKSMTFMNTCGTVLIAPNLGQIAGTLGRSVAEVEHLKGFGGLQVAFHEYGHNLGGHCKHLRQHGSPVEEVNAQACAAYIAARYMKDPTSVIEVASLWTPIRRAFQGPTEQHSKSDIYLIGRYLDTGAVSIRSNGEKSFLNLDNMHILLQTAFDEAIKMRLWEMGIPSEFHPQFLEPLDRLPGEGQDLRIKRMAEELLDNSQDKTLEWQERCYQEVDSKFNSSEMNKIAAHLKPVMDSCPTEQIMSFFPSRDEIQMLLGEA